MPEAAEEEKRRRKEALCFAFYFQGGCICGLQREVSPLSHPILLTEDFKLWTLPMHVRVNGAHEDTLMFYMQSLPLLNKIFSI